MVKENRIFVLQKSMLWTLSYLTTDAPFLWDFQLRNLHKFHDLKNKAAFVKCSLKLTTYVIIDLLTFSNLCCELCRTWLQMHYETFNFEICINLMIYKKLKPFFKCSLKLTTYVISELANWLVYLFNLKCTLIRCNATSNEHVLKRETKQASPCIFTR